MSSVGPHFIGSQMSFGINPKGDFKIKGFEKAVDNIKLRNFEPKIYNKNQSNIVNLVDETKMYWLRKSFNNERKSFNNEYRAYKIEEPFINPLRQSVKLPIKGVAINRRVLMTR